MTTYGWIKESDTHYTEGSYFKVNKTIFWRIYDKNIGEIVLRNTWTGEEQIMFGNVKKTRAIKIIRGYIREHPIYD